MPEAGAFSPRPETRTAKHAKKLSQFPLAAPSCFRQGIGSYTAWARTPCVCLAGNVTAGGRGRAARRPAVLHLCLEVGDHQFIGDHITADDVIMRGEGPMASDEWDVHRQPYRVTLDRDVAIGDVDVLGNGCGQAQLGLPSYSCHARAHAAPPQDTRRTEGKKFCHDPQRYVRDAGRGTVQSAGGSQMR